MTHADRGQAENIREAMAGAPLTEVERAKVEARISAGLSTIEARDIWFTLLRYGAAHKDMRIMLGLES